MRLLLQSKLYQIELQRWALISCLLVWAIISTYFALRNQRETLLVGIEPSGFARLITDRDDRYIQEELKSFLKEYIARSYNYNEKSYSDQVGKAADLMSPDLWDSKRSELVNFAKRLEKETLSQTARIVSLDLLGEGQVEGLIDVEVIQKIRKQNFKLKIVMQFKPKQRTTRNPWGYEVTEFSDVSL